MRTSRQGFTLIELAVVIGLIAIIAAVAVLHLHDTDTQAERVLIKNLSAQLVSAAGIYATEQGTPPNGFSDYVEDSATSAVNPKTISLKSFGGGTCQSSGTTITGCTFKKWTSITYTWNSGGQISVTAKGPNNEPL
jgi:prepilin-type N-terminal cleavage/methylation domain-containing protein